MTNKEALRIIANPQLGWTCAKYDCALTIVRNALDKQTPMKLDRADEDCVCGNCYEPIPRWDTKYCPECGQRIDWKE